jgi:hypothetical protein
VGRGWLELVFHHCPSRRLAICCDE